MAERLTSGRVAAWNYYYSRLSELERSGDLQLAKIPEHCRHNAHIFFILTDSPETEKELEKFMKSREIGVAQHYAPLHLCPMARRLGCASRPLPVSERLSKTMLRLPIFSSNSARRAVDFRRAPLDFAFRLGACTSRVVRSYAKYRNRKVAIFSIIAIFR